MARYQNPLFTNAGGGDVGGSMHLPRGYGGAPAYDPISPVVGAVTKFANMALGGDPEFERARLYGAQRGQIEAEQAGNKSLGQIISGWTDFSPEGIKGGVQKMAAAAAEAGIKPDQAFAFVRGLVANNPGTSEDTVARAVVAAGGGALGKDQAYTTGGQTAIRRDNERQNVAEYTYREGQANNRQGMVTGEMRRHNMATEGENARQFNEMPVEVMGPGNAPIYVPRSQSAGKQTGNVYKEMQTTARNNADNAERRRASEASLGETMRQFNEMPETVSTPDGPQIVKRSDAYGKSPMLNPLTVSPSATVLPQPGDPRVPGSGPYTAPARPENMSQLGAEIARLGVETSDPAKVKQGIEIARNSTAAAQPLDVSPKDTEGLAQLIMSRVPDGFDMRTEDRTSILTRAGQLYQQTRNAETAVAQAWKEIMGDAPATEGEWNPFKTNRILPQPRASAPAPQPSGTAQAAQPADPVSEARSAIARGANRDAVIARLKSLSIPIPPDL